MNSTCPPAQLIDDENDEGDEGDEGDEDTEADADVDPPAEPPVDLLVGGTVAPSSDGPPDELPHATRATTPTISQPPAHHRIRTPPGRPLAPTQHPPPHSLRDRRGHHRRPRRSRGAHPPPIPAMLETTPATSE
ncbi:hypothetical protein [Streptomyces sp. SAI-208]|uniref:hypothetical protein n=1 Tax=Streptomyces sp. SAI-208 TaxID=2940550 RepID=UPI0024760A42|nr:hypothetical protein [Streptomyces sp. SAI-208]